ncbi:MAG: replication initiator protein A [Gemmatimonadaceae bacterium]|nr:replication initiator protein A [Gemmatimonadaceae bacterium]
MTPAARRKPQARTVLLDRAIEGLPLFRLSDSSDDSVVAFTADNGGRWRVLPAPGERLPGTFDQDVYFELMRRYAEAEAPADGTLSFTLHAFLRSMGRRVDGRTYEQLRGALARLERTVLESEAAWYDAARREHPAARFTILSAVAIDRRRFTDRDQLALFPALASNEPGDARVTLAPQIRGNLAAGHAVALLAPRYVALSSPVARRLYRLLEAHRAESGAGQWRLTLERLAELLPLTQRYPSHLQRVIQPAHEMLVAAGSVKRARFTQAGRIWSVEYDWN